MTHTASNVVIYTADAAGLAALSAAIISDTLSASTFLMCPVGNQMALLSYTA